MTVDAARTKTTHARGLSLAPFRARRFAVGADRLGRLLSPPYDVIDDVQREQLIEGDADNVVSVILPHTADGSDRYQAAAHRLRRWTEDGPSGHAPLLPADAEPALYIYDMRSPSGRTRGVIGAVELRDPDDGVILPHENVMAGPVADRLALMDATDANLEPIYLVYSGGGATSELVASVDDVRPVAYAATPDGVEHRLWAVTDRQVHDAVELDLRGHSAVIADGHHRYATYRELQRRRHAVRGAGPWDRGLTLLVDTSTYGPQVEAIHRVVPGLRLDDALSRLASSDGRPVTVSEVGDARAATNALDDRPAAAAIAVVVTDGERAVVVEGLRAPGTDLGADLDVVAVHRDLIERRWGMLDTVDTVGYAHDVTEALTLAKRGHGVAVLLRPTPVRAVMDVAKAGGRMPRKSTLFMPKPASGLVIRRFDDV